MKQHNKIATYNPIRIGSLGMLMIAFLWPLVTLGQADSTRKAHTLEQVQIQSQKPVTNTSTTPTQMLDASQMEQLGMSTLGDAVKQLSGVTIKDYGGIGGIKTISARGLGSQFTTLMIDGVAISDCQNGQIDLGRYEVGNAEYVSFAQGQFSSVLQSARGLAAGNVLDMQTLIPKNPIALKAGLEGGSFGFISPTLSLQRRKNNHWGYSLWANYLHSEGDYPFTIYYTLSGQDSSSRERRLNSSISRATIDANLFYIDGVQDFTLKGHFQQSYNELPGPVIFYSINGTEFTCSQLAFLQARYRRVLGQKTQLQLLGKYHRTFDIYDDTSLLKTHNEYLQQEGYLSGTVAYSPLENLQLVVATDEFVNSLNSNLSSNNEILRFSSLNAFSLSYHISQLDLKANLLNTLSFENTNSGLEHEYKRLSPYLGGSVRIYPWKNENVKYSTLRLRYFFKENYRLPNFNEMYYFSLTRDLRPEKALQHNLGLTFAYTNSENRLIKRIELANDFYFNRVSDKIVAVPVQSLFLWSMMNIGLVEILGNDVVGEIHLHPDNTPVSFSIRANYTFQRAWDMTNPDSKTYKNQIPYTPRHSGGVLFLVHTSWVDMGYNLVCVGDRYRLGQNTDNTLVRGYSDHGITLSRDFFISGGKISVKGQVLNLFNKQYEVIKNYPMMGRNWRLAISYSL